MTDKTLTRIIEDDRIPQNQKAEFFRIALDHEARRGAEAATTLRSRWNTPLAIALTGLITMGGNLAVGYFAGIYKTSNTVTLKQLDNRLKAAATAQDSDLTEKLETLKAELAERANVSAGQRQLEFEERKFQYRLIEKELAATDRSLGTAAERLRMLSYIGVLNRVEHDKIDQIAKAYLDDEQGTPSPTVPRLTRLESSGVLNDLQREVVDYEALYKRWRGNELELARLGEAAFRNGEVEWAVRALQQAYVIQSSKVWQGRFGYLVAGHLLLGQTDAAHATADSILAETATEFGYLSRPAQIGWAMNIVLEAQEHPDLSTDDAEYMSELAEKLDTIIQEKQAIND